jgi:hypothetical protein
MKKIRDRKKTMKYKKQSSKNNTDNIAVYKEEEKFT